MTNKPPTPRKGLRFMHKRRGVECYVVRVTNTGVYYRIAGGIGGGNIHRATWESTYSPLPPRMTTDKHAAVYEHDRKETR